MKRYQFLRQDAETTVHDNIFNVGNMFGWGDEEEANEYAQSISNSEWTYWVQEADDQAENELDFNIADAM